MGDPREGKGGGYCSRLSGILSINKQRGNGSRGGCR